MALHSLPTRILCGLVSINSPLTVRVHVRTHTHLILLVYSAPTIPSFLVFKCSKLFVACAFVLAIDTIWIVFVWLASSICSPSNLLNCYLLRISDYSLQSSAPQATPLFFIILPFMTLIALPHCESTFI